MAKFRKRLITLGAAVSAALYCAGPVLACGVPGMWRINELYSNASGSVQFIELLVASGDEEQLRQNEITVSKTGAAAHKIQWQTDFGIDRAPHNILIGTKSFGMLNLVTPDVLVDDNFLFLDSGSVDYTGQDLMNYSGLPSDGVHSLYRNNSVDVNSPTNFAGKTGSIGPSGTPPVASLENPQPNSYQSGIGLISGWSCTAGTIVAAVDGKTMLTLPYGSARADTASVCGAGNTNTGFGLLLNYNTLGAGTHTASLMVNGTPVGSVQFNVTVPNGEFMTGMSKEVSVSDFPVAGKSTLLTWQQSQQNFAVKSVGAKSAVVSADTMARSPEMSGDKAATLASLENPQPDSYQSGIGLISGWSCTAGTITASVDGKTTLTLPYGSARADTASVCGAGNTNTGFGLLLNYNTLSTGTHTASLMVNGTPVGSVQFNVTVPSGEFMTGMTREVTVADFPMAGKNTLLTWQQSQQNFAVKSVAP